MIQSQARPLWDKRPKATKTQHFTPADCQLAKDRSHCICPAGKRLYGNGKDRSFNGYAAMKFRGAECGCVPCDLRQQCLRTPGATKAWQVAFFEGKLAGRKSNTVTDRMKAKIDSDTGKQMIAARFATVEPVFGNLRHNKWLTRFTRRGRAKMDGQWKLYCLMHSIKKLRITAMRPEVREGSEIALEAQDATDRKNEMNESG